MKRNFFKVNKLMWLLLMELENELEGVNGNGFCTDRKLWSILYTMPAPH